MVILILGFTDRLRGIISFMNTALVHYRMSSLEMSTGPVLC